MSAAGEMFGPYRIEAEIGHGGMAVVHRAVDTRKDRVIALKRLPAALAGDLRFGERFRREARATAALNHPNVIPIHDFGDVDGRLFLDMRLVKGTDLGSALRPGPLALRRIATILGQVAGALDTAHDDGLVHRDVKPSNILLFDPPDRHRGPDFAYLIDFGIAANLADSRLTSTGVIGTVDYMAPERFTHPDRAPDRRTDVYSLGCVLHECLTGRPPFRGTGPQVQWAHVHTAPPRPCAGRADLPPALDAIVATAMAKDPGRRHPDAATFAAAVQEVLGPVDAPGRSGAPVGPGWNWGSVAAALRAAVGLGSGPKDEQGPPSPPRRTRHLTDTPTARDASVRRPGPGPGGPPIGATTPRPPGQEPRDSADPAMIADGPVPPLGRTPAPRAFAVEVENPRSGRTGHTVATFAPAGNLLATDRVGATRTILWETEGGTRVDEIVFGRSATDGERAVTAIAFSPDGTLLASAVARPSGRGHGVVLSDIRGRTRTALAHHTEPINALAFTPDGALLATASQDRTVAVWDTGTCKRVQLHEVLQVVQDLAFDPSGTVLALARDGIQLVPIGLVPDRAHSLISETGAMVRGVTFSADGRRLATAGPRQTAVVWDVETRTEIRRFRHRNTVNGVALNADGTRLATAGSVQRPGTSRTCGYWDVDSGALLAAYNRTTTVNGVSLDPTGTMLAIASADHEVSVVELPP